MKRNKLYSLLVIISMALFLSCSDQGPNNDPGPQYDFLDQTSGVFYLTGKKFTTTYSDGNDTTSNGVNLDSTFVAMSVTVQLVSEAMESIRFYGIDGADVGRADRFVFAGCKNSSDCEVYGSLSHTYLFEIEQDHNNRSYQAEGAVYTTSMELNGIYKEEGLEVRYELSGRRIRYGLKN